MTTRSLSWSIGTLAALALGSSILGGAARPSGLLGSLNLIVLAANDDTDTGEVTLAGAVAADDRFRTLLAAVQAADLVELLDGKQASTVLAPIDEAFAGVPAEVLSALLRPENRDALTAVLQYHVLAGRVDSREIKRRGDIETAEGSRIVASIVDGAFRLNESVRVVQIELAVERGAPLFNRGEPQACAAIYEVTTAALLGTPAIREDTRSVAELTNALRQACGALDAREQAWILRRGLDGVYLRLRTGTTSFRALDGA